MWPQQSHHCAQKEKVLCIFPDLFKAKQWLAWLREGLCWKRSNCHSKFCTGNYSTDEDYYYKVMWQARLWAPPIHGNGMFSENQKEKRTWTMLRWETKLSLRKAQCVQIETAKSAWKVMICRSRYPIMTDGQSTSGQIPSLYFHNCTEEEFQVLWNFHRISDTGKEHRLHQSGNSFVRTLKNQ